ncbi:MAG TPA: septum formation initiator family protein [Candidatus Saccharimonadales bacterium]|jgi:cell division protein FtsB|nr:septum formation initiator family protein [Candidatus Saccharimonadales bacterium]
MQTKIKKYQDIALGYLKQLRDPRMIGLLLFLLIVLLIGWSGVKAIDTNYGLQRQIAKLQQQNEVQKLTNGNMKLQNDYYNTPQYLEISARKDFGLATKGETVLVVPRAVALAHIVDLPKPESEIVKKQAHQSAIQRNFNAWLDFFMNRKQTQ